MVTRHKYHLLLVIIILKNHISTVKSIYKLHIKDIQAQT